MSAPMTPAPYRVVERVVETLDSATLRLQPLHRTTSRFRPGQFMMLYAHGVGEVAISISGDPSTQDGSIAHTICAVGAVSRALHDASTGAVVGVRGPFGTGWDLGPPTGRDLVIVAGGVGLARLRPVVLAALADRDRYRRITLISGARTPKDFLYHSEQNSWAWHRDLDVCRTVDVPGPGWAGEVGFVTEPLAQLAIDPQNTAAFLCGPEPMMRFSAEVLLRQGVPAHAIQVSLERNMQCGLAVCGHCQLGPLLLCRDGPVVTYDVAEPLLRVREL